MLKLMNDQYIVYKDKISSSAKNLIDSLLQFDPDNRPNIIQILNSSWILNMEDQFCIPDNATTRVEHTKERKYDLRDARVGSICDFLYNRPSVVDKANDDNELISSLHSDDEDNTFSIIIIQ